MPHRLSLHGNAYKEKEGAKYVDISTPLEYILEMLGARFFEDMAIVDMVILRKPHFFCNI